LTTLKKTLKDIAFTEVTDDATVIVEGCVQLLTSIHSQTRHLFFQY
jgi:hypothetical protein